MLKWVDFLKIALTAIARDVRSGQIKMLVISTSLGVAALSSVGFLSNRLEAGLERDARQMLGGDAVVTSSAATDEEIVQKAKSLGLQSAQTLSFPTMARVGDFSVAKTQPNDSAETRLVSLKAVDASYPLRGELRILGEITPNPTGPSPPSPSVATQEVPKRGEVWVEPGLLEALGVEQGAMIRLGQAQFRVAKVLTYEPDKGVGFMSFAPRVLMNRADLESTQLVQPSSRINWRFAVAGNDLQIKAFSAWVQKSIEGTANRGVRLETLETGRPEVRQTLDRAAKFLRLVALLAVILSAVAVALAARNFSHQHVQDCAMRRVLGQSQRSITNLFVVEFMLLGLFASGVGLCLGYGVHYIFVLLLSGLVDTVLPAPSYAPVIQGL